MVQARYKNDSFKKLRKKPQWTKKAPLMHFRRFKKEKPMECIKVSAFFFSCRLFCQSEGRRILKARSTDLCVCVCAYVRTFVRNKTAEAADYSRP